MSKKINIWTLIMVLTHTFAIAKEESDTLRFIHITDTHICNLDGYNSFFAEKRQHYGNVTGSLSEFYELMPVKLKSDFMVITGDMIDFYEAESKTGSMMSTQIEQFMSLVDNYNIPTYMTLGNHDIASYWVNENSSYASNQLNAAKARAQWIKNASCFKNGTYYSRTFQVDTTTYRLIFLDNGYYSSERKVKEGAPNIIDKYQLLWLDNQLKISDNDVEIIFMHIPLITPEQSALEPSRNKYFLDEQDTLAIPYERQNQRNETFDLWSVLENNASTKVVFCGHHHSNVNNEVDISDDYSLNQVMTGSFARDARNWRLIQLTSESIIISFPGVDKVQYSISTR